MFLSVQNNNYSFGDYCSNLQKIRYRNGIINEYPSRLHYFSDWIQNNIQKGIIKEVTPKEGSLIQKQSINFMSSHADKYTPLTENAFFLKEIKNTEKLLSNMTVRYIPKDSLNSHNISQIHRRYYRYYNIDKRIRYFSRRICLSSEWQTPPFACIPKQKTSNY